MKSRLIIVSLAVLMLLSNGYWLYSTFDSGITATYQEQVTGEFAKRIVAVSHLADFYLRDMPKDSVLALMTNVYGKEEVFEKDDGIHAPWISLCIDEKGYFKKVIVDENVTAWTKRGTAK